MAQSSERDKYSFLTDEEWARRERVEEVNELSLDELQRGDRLGILADRGRRVAGTFGAAFVLEVSSKRRVNQGDKGGIRVTFRYYPGIFGFEFCTEEGEHLTLEPASVLVSGFSSLSSHSYENHPPHNPDYAHIKTGESYWFVNPETERSAIAQRINKIGLLRKANL